VDNVLLCPRVVGAVRTLLGARFGLPILLSNHRMTPEVRKTPSQPRGWANSSPLLLHSHRNAWASLRLLGRPNSLLAGDNPRGGAGLAPRRRVAAPPRDSDPRNITVLGAPEVFATVSPRGKYFRGPDKIPGGSGSRAQVAVHRGAALPPGR
jgi:hypothetical protein